jgi:hypothetical protein
MRPGLSQFRKSRGAFMWLPTIEVSAATPAEGSVNADDLFSLSNQRQIHFFVHTNGNSYIAMLRRAVALRVELMVRPTRGQFRKYGDELKG